MQSATAAMEALNHARGRCDLRTLSNTSRQGFPVSNATNKDAVTTDRLCPNAQCTYTTAGVGTTSANHANPVLVETCKRLSTLHALMYIHVGDGPMPLISAAKSSIAVVFGGKSLCDCGALPTYTANLSSQYTCT
jgi:hypothetical protein